MSQISSPLDPGPGEFSGQLLTRAVSRDVPEVMLATQNRFGCLLFSIPRPQLAPANPHDKLCFAWLFGFVHGSHRD
jgi:hypothetical protein